MSNPPSESAPNRGKSSVALIVAAIGLVASVAALFWPVGHRPMWVALVEGVVAAAFAAVLLAIFNARSISRRG